MTGDSWPMLRTMTGVGLVCGALIVMTYEATKPAIARNQAEALEAAIFQVLPSARSSRAFRLDASGSFAPLEGEAKPGDALVYPGYDEAGRLSGFAIEGAGMGYQDTIRLLFGYEPGGEVIVGMQVLESKETPGLGDKIASDEGFQKNFDALDVKLNAAGDALVNAVVAVKRGEKTQPWQVDGITGATISSVAVADIVRNSASFWLPRIQGNLHVFERGTVDRGLPAGARLRVFDGGPQ